MHLCQSREVKNHTLEIFLYVWSCLRGPGIIKTKIAITFTDIWTSHCIKSINVYISDNKIKETLAKQIQRVFAFQRFIV